MKGINLLGQGGISRIVIDIIKNNSKEYFIQSIYDDSELKKNTSVINISDGNSSFSKIAVTLHNSTCIDWVK